MKSTVFSLLALGLCSGCVMTRPIAPAPQAPRQATDVKVTPANVSVSPAQPAPAATPTAVHGRATTAVCPLRVLVSLDDGNGADKPLTCKKALQTSLEGALARAGFKVVYDKPAEILVSGDLRATQTNARGTRVSCKGDLHLAVTRAPEINTVTGRTMRDIVAKKRFDAKSGDARSDDDAQKRLADRLAGGAAAFAAEGVNKVGDGIKRIEMTIINAWQPQDAAGYPTLFTQTVATMKGVYACRVLTTDNAARTMKVEVIYDAAEYPDGFLNRLYVVPALNIAR